MFYIPPWQFISCITVPKHMLNKCVENDETLSSCFSNFDLIESSSMSFTSKRRACFHIFKCSPIVVSQRPAKRQIRNHTASQNGPGLSTHSNPYNRLQKHPQTYPKIIPTSSPNHHRIIPNSSPNHHQIIPT